MRQKIANGVFVLLNLFTVILLFTIIDHFIHGLEDTWSVPPHYFINKVPYGFMLAVIGLLLSIKIKNIWLKSLVVGGFTAIAIQTKYLIETILHGTYTLHFVILFAFLHFFMLFPLLVIMFHFYYKYKDNRAEMSLRGIISQN